jgi:hypothetical protein
LAPAKPTDQTVDEILDTLKGHFEEERIVIAERYRFYQRSQLADESVAKFAAELRRLAIHCEFQDHLNEALRDRMVFGLRNKTAQSKLLGEKALTFKKAIDITT